MTRDRNILRDLLLRDLSAAQLVVYAIGSYLGLLILTGALQLWRDFSTSPDGSSDDPFASEDYVIFSPKVKGLGFGAAQGLPDTLLTTLNSQPWVVSADRFSAADFSVTVSADFGGDRLASALFFESVPDGYLQPLPDSWAFDPYGPDSVIPIILPRDYLALYNFGFAPSRGFPSLGEEVVMHIPLSVSLAGRGRQQVLPARIVGFSNRINTISVPEAFLQWANKNFGDVRMSDGSSSRIIAHISVEASDPLVRDFAESHDLDIAGDDGNVSPSRILSVILAIVMGVGAILCTLSVVILTVSLFLLLYKSRPVIVRLVSLGFSIRSIRAVYGLMLAFVNVAVWLACVATLAVGHNLISPLLADAAVGGASLSVTVVISFLLMAFIHAVGIVTIRIKTRI